MYLNARNPYWAAFDVYSAIRRRGHVAYWAHLGGFGAGFLTATLLLYSGLIQMTSTEQSLYDVLGD
ncbi:MAG: rhomboid family intramembrane serine protease [Candidatus Hydrogenedentes bacterium]|nr:rhomboid family intramembrane serine protease [Candidatus Hydrogenedentota bacterium]